MEEIIESSVNAEPIENVVDSQETAIEQENEAVNADNGEVVTPQNRKVQDAETNRIYAEARRSAEAYAQKQIDQEYDRLYGQEYGIHSKADYDAYMKQVEMQQEAQKKGIDPEFYKEFNDLKEQVNMTKAEKQEYERQLNLIKEDETLQKDETFSDYYKEYASEIKDMANKFKVDLTTAMLLSIKDNFKAIKEGTVKKAQQETINNIIKNGSTSPGSVSAGGNLEKKSVWNMSADEFNALKEKALRGEIKEF